MGTDTSIDLIEFSIFATMKRIAVSVSNDLVSDNRVEKTCRSLQASRLDVVLIGRRRRGINLPLGKRNYRCRRMRLLFETSALYYAELNVRLFVFLLCHKQDILWSNDLDTLPANYLVSKLKRLPLIYDSHEHFTEVPELKYNRFAKKAWKFFERKIVPNLTYVVTVCNPIAEYFKTEYGINAVIVRNMPLKQSLLHNEAAKSGFNFVIRHNKPVLIWQGAVNIERGLEELIEAMNDIEAYLYVVGEGLLLPSLKQMATAFGLNEKVFFIGRLPYPQMMALTRQADLGLSLDKSTNMNYAISLPNKVFEYISAHIPLLVSDLQEIRSAIRDYEVGEFICNISSEEIAKRIKEMLADKERLAKYKANTFAASEVLCWENEETKIANLINEILNKTTK
ncbi:MAG: glycosyltransferase [Bacteroidales bacterium]|nr:glycosyltransferase [Bacteroidales bacterium]